MIIPIIEITLLVAGLIAMIVSVIVYITSRNQLKKTRKQYEQMGGEVRKDDSSTNFLTKIYKLF
jgi:hypothetical protein